MNDTNLQAFSAGRKTLAADGRVFKKPKYARIMARDGFACVYCGSRDDLVIDHIRSIARGGTHDDDNLATACFLCNSSKGGLLPSEWPGRGQSNVSAAKRAIRKLRLQGLSLADVWEIVQNEFCAHDNAIAS